MAREEASGVRSPKSSSYYFIFILVSRPIASCLPRDPFNSTLGQQGKGPGGPQSRRGFARAFIERTPISAEDKSKLAHRNAERLLAYAESGSGSLRPPSLELGWWPRPARVGRRFGISRPLQEEHTWQ